MSRPSILAISALGVLVTHVQAAQPLNCSPFLLAFPPLTCESYCALQYPNDHRARVLCTAAGHHGQGPCFSCPCYSTASFTRPKTCPQDEICEVGPTMFVGFVAENFVTDGCVLYDDGTTQRGSATTTLDPDAGVATGYSCSYGTGAGFFPPDSVELSGLSSDQATACTNILLAVGKLGPYGRCLKRG